MSAFGGVSNIEWLKSILTQMGHSGACALLANTNTLRLGASNGKIQRRDLIVHLGGTALTWLRGV